jgi:uncharacterized protein (TIGR02145 family)
MIYNLDCHCINFFNGNEWVSNVQGSDPVFECGEYLTDDRDGKMYATVLIGDQCWMAENLNIGTKINSTGGFQQTDNGIIEKYCYNNEEDSCNIYGALYEWAETMQYDTAGGTQGICPNGWHIPTKNEWTDLLSFLGNWAYAGGKMKSTGTIEAGTGLWYAPNQGATNESGFTGLPGGFRVNNLGAFLNLGYEGTFWSSSQYDASRAWYMYLDHFAPSLSQYYQAMDYGISVRCLKDAD